MWGQMIKRMQRSRPRTPVRQRPATNNTSRAGRNFEANLQRVPAAGGKRWMLPPYITELRFPHLNRRLQIQRPPGYSYAYIRRQLAQLSDTEKQLYQQMKQAPDVRQRKYLRRLFDAVQDEYRRIYFNDIQKVKQMTGATIPYDLQPSRSLQKRLKKPLVKQAFARPMQSSSSKRPANSYMAGQLLGMQLGARMKKASTGLFAQVSPREKQWLEKQRARLANDKKRVNMSIRAARQRFSR